MSQKSISIYTLGWILLFLVVLYFPVFHYLGHHTLHIWDESLFGLRALYMLQHGEYMFNFNLYEDFFDHANTKLPFTTWIQVVSMSVLGTGELALRLPISIIFLLTVYFIIRYTYKHLGSPLIGVIFTLILLCSEGIVRNHMLRSGEHDMPFICYLIVGIVAYFQYLQSKESRHIILFTVSMIAAFLTKNLLAGVVIPGMLLYTLLCGHKNVLADKKIWYSCLAIIAAYTIVIYTLHIQNSGFLTRMWDYELMGRYTEAKDGHKGDFWYFIRDLALTHFRFYFWMVPISLIILIDKKLSEYKKQLIIYLSILFFSYLLIISFAQTKLFWYGMPTVPIAALLLGVVLHHVYIQHIYHWRRSIRLSLIILFTMIFFVIPYGLMLKKIMEPPSLLPDERYGPFMERIAIDHPTIKNYTIADSNTGFALTYWREKYNSDDQGFNISSTREPIFEQGDTIMTCVNNIYDTSYKNYQLEMIQTVDKCHLYIIKNKK